MHPHMIAAHAHHGFTMTGLGHVLHSPIAAIIAVIVLVFCLPSMLGRKKASV